MHLIYCIPLVYISVCTMLMFSHRFKHQVALILLHFKCYPGNRSVIMNLIPDCEYLGGAFELSSVCLVWHHSCLHCQPSSCVVDSVSSACIRFCFSLRSVWNSWLLWMNLTSVLYSWCIISRSREKVWFGPPWLWHSLLAFWLIVPSFHQNNLKEEPHQKITLLSMHSHEWVMNHDKSLTVTP